MRNLRKILEKNPRRNIRRNLRKKMSREKTLAQNPKMISTKNFKSNFFEESSKTQRKESGVFPEEISQKILAGSA